MFVAVCMIEENSVDLAAPTWVVMLLAVASMLA